MKILNELSRCGYELLAVVAIILIVAVFIAKGSVEYGRGELVVGGSDFSSSDLPSDGSVSRKVFDFTFDGAVDQVRVYKSGENCTGVEWWLLERDEAATSAALHTAVIADNKDNLQSENYVNWRPSGGAVYFKSEISSSGKITPKLAVEVKAHGSACSASVKVFGRNMIR